MATFTTPNQARDQFILIGNPYFYIKGKKDVILLRNETENDIEIASEKLYNWLNNNQDTTEILIFTVPSIPKGGITKAKIEDGTGIYYQNKKTYTDENKAEYWATKKSGLEMQLFDMFERMQNNIEQRYQEKERKLDEKLDALLELQNSEPDEKIEDNVQQNFLSGLLGNPGVQSIITALLTNLSANILTQQKNQPMNPIRPMAMAGTEPNEMEPNEEIAMLIGKLFEKGVTIEHLRKLAELPKLKIQSLLMML